MSVHGACGESVAKGTPTRGRVLTLHKALRSSVEVVREPEARGMCAGPRSQKRIHSFIGVVGLWGEIRTRHTETLSTSLVAASDLYILVFSRNDSGACT